MLLVDRVTLPRTLLWVAAIAIVLFAQIGAPTFWDPDEAHYAQTSREMLAAGNWWVPLFNDEPFFDKPILFHVLQMLAYASFGVSEASARLVSVVGAIGLTAVTWWCGAALVSAEVGEFAGLLVLTMPGTFALARYAILDTVFATWLFGGFACLSVALLRRRRHLQPVGFVFIALAVLTKGPVAVVLLGLVFAALWISGSDVRRLASELRWGLGAVIVVALSGPWFLAMWWRFGQAFVDVYVLRENLWLFLKPLYQSTRSHWFYLRVLAVSLLPWSTVGLGRLVDVVRDVRRGTAVAIEERLLWSWVIAIVAFFSLSRFKLDHYIFPVGPAAALLIAMAWSRWTAAPRAPENAGVRLGIWAVGPTLIGLGVAGILYARRLPIDLPATVRALPALFFVGGLGALLAVRRQSRAPFRIPLGAVSTIVAAYALVITLVAPEVERGKTVPLLARWVDRHADPRARIGAFQLHRWGASWRFYVGRHTDFLDDETALATFFETSEPAYCAMVAEEFDRLGTRVHQPLNIATTVAGLASTSGGQGLAGDSGRWRRFVVVTNVEAPPAGREPPERQP